MSSALSKPKTKPRMIFCASDDCNRTFGLGKKAAYALGKFGIVVSKRAWKPFYIRHEIIHHLQYETLGTFKVLLLTPAWFTEGMAYDLSEDPRTPLSEPFETARTEFKAWYSVQSKDSLWLAAAKL
ncbi:MAG: hypothetical protein OEZ58_10595 [Gammaproteobacteria bacterium]|nr:hypothetical protein [Gammaproteobacteria bacterium]